MATQSCHRISQGIWFSVFQYIGIPLTDYPCQILWQLGVAIGFWVSSFRVQNPMVCSPWFNLWKHWPRMFWFDFLFLESWNTLCSLTCGVPLGPCDVFMTSGFCAEPVISSLNMAAGSSSELPPWCEYVKDQILKLHEDRFGFWWVLVGAFWSVLLLCILDLLPLYLAGSQQWPWVLDAQDSKPAVANGDVRCCWRDCPDVCCFVWERA